MKSSVLIFALLTGLFWGMYGPALGLSRSAEKSAFKPYLMIGLAYLIWGVIGGVAGVKATNANFHFSGSGTLWGLIAGSLGAWGALTLTLAMFRGGSGHPQVVMALVFGSAVTVAAVVSLYTTSSWKTSSPWLWVGIAGVTLSAILVAYNTPHAAPAKKAQAPDQTAQAAPTAITETP
jgi:hypothetical protein